MLIEILLQREFVLIFLRLPGRVFHHWRQGKSRGETLAGLALGQTPVEMNSPS